ncbi:MAG: beta-agarase [Planctomycetota bacterium]
MRAIRKLFAGLAIVSLIGVSTVAYGQNGSAIGLEEIDGRTWLIDPTGRPFFAHGVTHVGQGGHTEDVHDIAQACKDLGFNAYGYGCPPELRSDMPYVDGRNGIVPMSIYRTSNNSFRYVDVFDPAEQARMTGIIRQMCQSNQGNPNLIGYYWTDLGAWNLENPTGTNWVEFIRSLPEDAPGQQAYRDFLETWQGDDDEARDRAFLRLIAREYFRTLGEANREYDPDRLIFGDRFTFQMAVPEVLEEIVPYVDAIAIQPQFNPGFPERQYDRIHELTGKPIVICDFAIRFQEEGKNIRGWRPQETDRLAGQRYAEYVREAFAKPYIIGMFWCNPINSGGEFGNGGIKQGLYGKGLVPRPGLHEEIRELNRYLEENTPAASDRKAES